MQHCSKWALKWQEQLLHKDWVIIRHKVTFTDSTSVDPGRNESLRGSSVKTESIKHTMKHMGELQSSGSGTEDESKSFEKQVSWWDDEVQVWSGGSHIRPTPSKRGGSRRNRRRDPHPHEDKRLNSFKNDCHKNQGVSENVCVHMNALDTHRNAVKHMPDL